MESTQPITSAPVIPLPFNSESGCIENYEVALQQIREWLSLIYPPSKIDRALQTEILNKGTSKEQLKIRVRIWTAINQYYIVAIIDALGDHKYLGCQASARKPRTGETWTRGNDLPDGKFCEETWQKILAGIIRYEAEEVKSELWKNESQASPKGNI